MKKPEVVYEDCAAGAKGTSKTQSVKPASNVAARSSVDEQEERGLLPWVKLRWPSYVLLIYLTGNVSWFLSLLMPKRARTKP